MLSDSPPECFAIGKELEHRAFNKIVLSNLNDFRYASIVCSVRALCMHFIVVIISMIASYIYFNTVSEANRDDVQ